MRPSGMHYFPLAWPALVGLLLLFLLVVALFEFGVVKSYERMGIPPRYVWTLLLLSVFGSAINIPVAELPPEKLVSPGLVYAFGIPYVVPLVRQWPGTIIAVNIGGALIPVILSLYLLIKNKLYLRAPFAIGVVTAVTYMLARPVRGVGIGVPIIIPPIIAAVAAMLFDFRRAAPLAYIAGSLGTLIGADVLNLGKVQGLGAPIASIGGAGTFDGIFLTGIVAVFLAPAARSLSQQ